MILLEYLPQGRSLKNRQSSVSGPQLVACGTGGHSAALPCPSPLSEVLRLL